MAQFDSLIILPLIFALLITLIIYYNISITITAPNFFGVKKFRKKKLDTTFFYTFLHNNNKIKTLISYQVLFSSLKQNKI